MREIDKDTETEIQKEKERETVRNTERERDRDTGRQWQSWRPQRCLGGHGMTWGRQRTIWKDTRWYPMCIDGDAVGQL